MSGETVLQNVYLGIGKSNTTAQLSGAGVEIEQLRLFINEAGADIARRTHWAGMHKTLAVNGQLAKVSLPSDFFALAESGSAWRNKTAYTPIRVVADEGTWAFIDKQNSAQSYCHIAGGYIHFAPTLDGDGASIRYVSSQWVEGKDVADQNGDTFLIPERLIEKSATWRWKRHHNLPYDDLMAEAEADIITEIQANRGAK